MYCADLTSGSDGLASAFSGADVIYALTDFWQTQSTDDEIAQGKSIAEAAAQTPTLKHFIWSALPDPLRLSGGLFMNVHHWKGKSLVTEYIRNSKPELWAKTTTILFPNYFENCLTRPDRYFPVKVSANPRISAEYPLFRLYSSITDFNLIQGASGIYTLTFPHSPDTVMPNVSIADTGKLVRTILEEGSQYFSKTIAFYSQGLSEADKLATMGKRMLRVKAQSPIQVNSNHRV
jgi:hypothetical protein